MGNFSEWLEKDKSTKTVICQLNNKDISGGYEEQSNESKNTGYKSLVSPTLCHFQKTE